jgi:hypothetical protein
VKSFGKDDSSLFGVSNSSSDDEDEGNGGSDSSDDDDDDDDVIKNTKSSSLVEPESPREEEEDASVEFSGADDSSLFGVPDSSGDDNGNEEDDGGSDSSDDDDDDTNNNASSSSPKKKANHRYGQGAERPPARRGYGWPVEEIAYVEAVVAAFKSGFLDVPEGTMLSKFLAEKLQREAHTFCRKFPGKMTRNKGFVPAQRSDENEAEIKRVQVLDIRQSDKSVSLDGCYLTFPFLSVDYQ